MNFQTTEDIILQHSTRGMDKIQKYFPNPHCYNAVHAFLEQPKGTIFIYTGFYVAGFAETDGPIGAYFLAKTFKTLGYQPIIITDSFCEGYFEPFETIFIPIDGLDDANYEALLDTHQPICHFSIERCGQNKNGDYLNSRGVNIKEFTAPVDELFKRGNKRTISIAIGDGGNEVGMGSFEEVLKHKEDFFDYCVVASDFPIIASVSNWGAYGFIAELAKALHVSLLPSFDEVDTYLGFIVSKGSVDGIKRESVKSVDGKEWSIEKEILDALAHYAKG